MNLYSFVLLCLLLFKKRSKCTTTCSAYSAQVASSFFIMQPNFSLAYILLDMIMMWSARCEDPTLMHNFFLCFLSTARYWAKYIWSQGNNIHYAKSNAKEKDDQKFWEKHQILRKFYKIFNILWKAIRTLTVNIPFPHHRSQKKVCHWALPGTFRSGPLWVCLIRRRWWALCTRTKPMLRTELCHTTELTTFMNLSLVCQKYKSCEK